MQTVIIHNEHPANRYGAYLVNKVGSIEWETLLVIFGKRQPNNRVIKKALKKKGFLLQ